MLKENGLVQTRISSVDYFFTRSLDLDEAARILIASGRLKWDTRSAIRWSCTTNVHIR